MRILKLVAIALGAVIGLLLIAVVVLILRFDPNDYKPELTDAFEARTGRSIEIADEIGWSLFPWLAIETGGIAVGNHPDFGTGPFATIDTMSARVRVWPLLRRQIELGLITVDGFSLDVGTNAAGITNWSDLIAPAGESDTARTESGEAAGASTIADIEIAGIRLNDGRILWREAGEVRYVVSGANVETGRIAPDEPVQAALDFSVLDVASQRRANLDVTTIAALDGDAVSLSSIELTITAVDSNGLTRATAELATEAITITGGTRIAAAEGSVAVTATNPPFGPGEIDAQIDWPSFEIDIAAGRAHLDNVRTTVNGVTADWTLDAEDLSDTPRILGSVDIPPVPAAQLLATAGVEAPVGLDAESLGSLAGRGSFTASTAGTATLDGFAIELLGMSILVDGSVTEDAGLEATVSIPPFAPNESLAALIAAELPDARALGEADTLSLNAALATNIGAPERLTVTAIRFVVDAATVTGDVDIEIAEGAASRVDGAVVASVPDPELIRSLLGDSFPSNLEAAAIGPSTLEARFDYALGNDALSVASFDLETFGLKANGNLTANSLRTAPVVRGRGTLARFDPQATLARLDQPAPQTSDPNAFSSAAFSGEYVIDAAHAEFRNMNLDIDDMRITGSLSVEDFESPKYRFDLATDTLDADRYLPPGSDDAADGERTAGDIQLANEPLELLDLVGTARVGALKLANLEFQQVVTTLTIGGGRARIAPARTRLYGGEFDGSLAVDTTGDTPSMRLSGRATNLALAPLITALTGESNVRGTGNFDLDLTGTGATVTDTLHTAAGSMSFSLTGGAIEGFNLGRALCAAYNLRERLPQPASAPDETTYELIRAAAQVTDGIASSSDLLARTAFMDVTGSGRMNIADAQVDYDMVAALTAAVPVRGCEAMTEFVGDSIPFTIEGPLSDPEIEPDYREILRNRVQDEVRDRVRDRLQDRIRDLL